MSTATKLSVAAERAFENFKRRFYYAEPEPYARFDTDWNKAVLHDCITQKFAPGADGLVDTWELAYRLALRSGDLQPIPGFEMPVAEEDFAALDNMSAAEYKQRMQDPKFADLVERAERQRAKRGPYDGMTATQYRSMPALVRQQKLTYEEPFRVAVQRLIDAGEL